MDTGSQRGELLTQALSGEARVVSYLATQRLESLEPSAHYSGLLVCLHQSPSHAESFEALRRALARRAPSLFILALDTPGFGGSEPLSTPSASQASYPSLAELASPLSAVITRFSEALSSPQLHLLGHHTGASLALELAGRAAHAVSSLALIGLPTLPPEELDAYRRYTDELRERVRREQATLHGQLSALEPLLEAHLKVLREELQQKDPEASTAVIERELRARFEAGERLPDVYQAVFDYDHAEALSRLRAPILLIAPELDRLSAFRDYQLALIRSAALKASSVALSGGGYVLDSAPELLAATLAGWLDELHPTSTLPLTTSPEAESAP